jgi:uncharacterized protein YbaP (TraB family)
MTKRPRASRFGKAPTLLAVIVCMLASGCVTVPVGDEIERPALWRVDKPDGSVLWLLGTVHWLPADQQPEAWRMDGWLRHRRYLSGQPLPAPWNHGPMYVALRTMDRLVVESVGQPSDAEIATVASTTFGSDECRQKEGTTPGFRTDAASSPESGAPLAAQFFVMNETRPRPVRDADNVGLEFWLGTLAVQRGVPVFALENLELRARAARSHLERKSCEERRAVVDKLAILRSEPSESQPEQPRAYVLWRDGEIERLGQELERFDDDNPELFRALVSGRNPFWIDALIGHVQAPGDVLVAVGMAHLAGPDNLLQLLAERGIEARRVQ